MFQLFKRQKKRKNIPFFAPWSVIEKPFSAPKHYLDGNRICYDVISGEEYANHVEMSGFFASSIISYGVDRAGNLRMLRHVVYPTLRLYPNQTHNSLDWNFNGVALKVNGKEKLETVSRFVFDGNLHIYGSCGSLDVEREIFTARNAQACVEILRISNNGDHTAKVEILNRDLDLTTSPKYGVDWRSYRLYVQLDTKTRCVSIEPGKSATVQVAYCGAEKGATFRVDCESERLARAAFISEIDGKYVVETPDVTINMMARYAKIRACESIYQTKSGLMHSPGGGGYYAAVWTNDQCEYINPLFAYLGYGPGTESAMNCYQMYQKYISPHKPLITSIIAQGDGIWHGAKDRGDSAMYAYGCSRFLLTLGDRAAAQNYMESIRDCLRFTLSQTNKQGVIRSDSDELENRFKSGKANLCTSSLAYDALVSASYLESEFGNRELSDTLKTRAAALREAIERTFGREVEGYSTYQYCKEEKKLRSWIAIPLVMGITERSAGTARALMSPLLRKGEGVVTRSGEKTFWDRSTLYALRGLFYAGMQEQAVELLERYSAARLLGEHIPYAVEAFPEGNQAHLSGESGLYLRIFMEGILGYRPTGFGSFELAPNLPEKWDSFSIKNVTLCGYSADICISRVGEADYSMMVQYAGHIIQATGKKNLFVFAQ